MSNDITTPLPDDRVRDLIQWVGPITGSRRLPATLRELLDLRTEVAALRAAVATMVAWHAARAAKRDAATALIAAVDDGDIVALAAARVAYQGALATDRDAFAAFTDVLDAMAPTVAP